MTQVNISKGIVLDVDFDALMQHDELVAKAVQFAVKQALTNTHAGISKKQFPDKTDGELVDMSRAVAEKRLAAMLNGDWAMAERGPRGDEVAREIRAIAEKAVRAGLVKAGIKVASLGKGVFSKLLDKQVAAKGESYRAEAERRVAESKALVDDELEIDLDDLTGGDESDESDTDTE